ncbi:MAG: 1-deoxy-D-xylulose-5-phosphate reductoisomerase [Nakamurella sp.]
MTAVRRLTILGSTGSVGTQALDIVRANPDLFRLVGLSAGGGNPALFAAQAAEFPQARTAVGAQASARLVEDVDADLVLNAITGSVGLAPTLSTLKAGRTLALANKESLVAGGSLVTRAAAPGQIVPVDSEHSALAQALRSGTHGEVAVLVLTASGGPFRGRTRDQLREVTAAQALAHPTWAMGPVVTLNSATLVNKGLELIEAHLLFDIPYPQIQVVVHPQSIVHSMVTFIDGSTIAQASPPDMKLPIALGLGWPDRVPRAAAACDFSQAQSWMFEPVDHVTFPSLNLARRAGEAGGRIPAVFNAANEELVAAFLSGNLAFPLIPQTLERILESSPAAFTDDATSIADVTAAESWARTATMRELGRAC